MHRTAFLHQQRPSQPPPRQAATPDDPGIIRRSRGLLRTLSVLAIGSCLVASTAVAEAQSVAPNTYDFQIVTGEGHQVTATWRSTEPSHFHCWLTTSLVRAGLPDANAKGADSVGPVEHTRGATPGLVGQALAPRTSTARLPCTPPKTYDGLAPGTYTLHVAAFGNESGLRDPTPATGTFRLP